MKILQTQISPFVNNPLYLDFKELPYLSSLNNGKALFHEHPELQLTFILEGFGKRIIGNKVSRFESGDMVFLGPNVPHIWLSDPVFFKEGSNLLSKVITVYIDYKIFEQMFNSLKEMDGIKEMISQASKGINIYGETRNVIAEKLISLRTKSGFEKVVEFLQIMNLITISPEKNLINKKNIDAATGHSSDRLVKIIDFMKNHLEERVSLSHISELACMTIPSFCRFFKNSTGKTFSEYLMQLRIEHSHKLLIELDKPISDIASLCGFVSHSHFCKVFKDHTGMSPYQYKCSIKATKKLKV